MSAATSRRDDGGRGVSRRDERLRRWRLVLGGHATIRDADGTGVALQGAATPRIDAALGGDLRRPRPATGRAAAGAPAGSGARRRRWPAGSATSAATSRRRWCRCCSATPSTASTCGSCCSSRRCCSGRARSAPRHAARRAEPAAARDHPGDGPPGGRRGRRQISRRLATPTQQAVHGALARSQRSRRPRPADIDWPHTILANLRNYLPEQRTVVPERLSATAGASAAWPATWSSPSTRAGRWPTASSTPRCSAPCSPRCRRCAPRWSPSTRASPTSPPWPPIPSTCCSASSSAAAPTSPRRWATAAS